MPGKQNELKVRDVIARDLTQEPNTVVKVDELALLRTDIAEYVLDESLAKGFADIFEPLVEANKPAAKGGGKVGVWVSGFFGTGKSHFAKLAGHLIADTPIDGTTSARDAFRALLHEERDRDRQLAELLHEADAANIRGQLVAFDIATQHSGVGDQAAYMAFLSAFYESIGFSDIPAFAEAELEMLERGVYDAFLARFEKVVGQPWVDARRLSLISSRLAEVLADVLPEMYSSAAAAESALDKSLEDLGALNTKKVVDRIIQWLKIQESLDGPKMVVFVADEVGAWAGHDLQRIEQVRALSETIESEGRGKIWMIVTSQESLSAVVQNTSFASTSEADNFQQRLEARFWINIHLASEHAGMVVEERILRKKTDKRPLLAELWSSHTGQLADLAEPPGLQMGHEYPRAEEDHFIQSYPFLPYELPAAGDIFGPMRSVKVSGGARSMIGVAFDALRELADKELGSLVAWDTIFDAANRDNEFADEHYLGGQGLTYIKSADKDLKDAPVRPSRLLKTLWLVQQSPSVARNPKNLARLLADNVDSDLLLLRNDIEVTLDLLAGKHFVAQDPGTDQWRFLTQEQVTLERILEGIQGNLKQKELRDTVSQFFIDAISHRVRGDLAMGVQATTFKYALFFNGAPIKNAQEPVQLQVALTGSELAKGAKDAAAQALEDPVAWWVLDPPGSLSDRVRRMLAVERLPQSDEFKSQATEKLKSEQKELSARASETRCQIERQVEDALSSGTIYWAGQEEIFSDNASVDTRARIEQILSERTEIEYHRFAEADRPFAAANIPRLLSSAPSERGSLDPKLGFFDDDGHVQASDPILEELGKRLQSEPKTDGKAILNLLSSSPFGWPPDLVRYAAAALFVDGKLSLKLKSGVVLDDPSAKVARDAFGIKEFKETTLVIEEDSLTPPQADTAWKLLADLGKKPEDKTETSLKQAGLLALSDIRMRSGAVDRARDSGIPLPESFNVIVPLIDQLTPGPSRTKFIRGLIERGNELKSASKNLSRLGEFEKHSGLQQFQRALRLRDAAIQGGLLVDPSVGNKVASARDDIEATLQQQRVLEDWDGPLAKARADMVDAFRSVYVPLREKAAAAVSEARDALQAMPEFDNLTDSRQASIRASYLSPGRPLAEISLPDMKDEAQLVAADAELSLGHLQSLVVSIDTSLGDARADVIRLLGEGLSTAPAIETWNPTKIFGGRRFENEEELIAAMDQERDRLLELIRAGKTIVVI